MSIVHKGAFETWQLQLGDVALFVGDEKGSQLKNRTVYLVVGKEAASTSSYSHNRYQYRVAFDLENPSGTSLDVFTGLGTRGMRKLELLDLGVIRMMLDRFIRGWSRDRGADEAAPADDGPDGGAGAIA